MPEDQWETKNTWNKYVNWSQAFLALTMIFRHEQFANVVVGQHSADDHLYQCIGPGIFQLDISVSCL